MKVIRPKQGENPGCHDAQKKRNAGNDAAQPRIEQDLRKQSTKAPTFLFWTTREHQPMPPATQLMRPIQPSPAN